MNTHERIDRFLETIDHPVSRAYYQTILNLLLALEPDLSEIDGFGCMRLLELTRRITLKDGTKISDDFPFMGTIIDLADIIAVIFAPIHSERASLVVGKLSTCACST